MGIAGARHCKIYRISERLVSRTIYPHLPSFMLSRCVHMENLDFCVQTLGQLQTYTIGDV